MSLASRFPAFTAWYARLSWWRLIAARRAASVLLLLIAAGLAVRTQFHQDGIALVVAAHDLRPGTTLTTADLMVSWRPVGLAPAGGVADVKQLIGRAVSGPVRAGEAVTDARVITPRLAQLAIGAADARIVPVHLPDQAVADLLRPGDVVDVVTVPQHRPGLDEDATTKQTGLRPPEVLARGAVVVLVSDPGRSRSAEGQVALIAMPDKAAQTVAAVTLVQAVTLLLR